MNEFHVQKLIRPIMVFSMAYRTLRTFGTAFFMLQTLLRKTCSKTASLPQQIRERSVW